MLSYNGRYYTRKDPTCYDRFGLFSHNGVFFSQDNTLGETIRRLVWESEAGWTQRELQDVLWVRVQVVLLNTFHQGKVDREKVHGFYVYLHTDPAVRGVQLNRRQERAFFEAPTKDGWPEIEDPVIIQVLLTLLHHPGEKACDRFFVYVEALHLARVPELRRAMQDGYPLHLDAICEHGT